MDKIELRLGVRTRIAKPGTEIYSVSHLWKSTILKIEEDTHCDGRYSTITLSEPLGIRRDYKCMIQTQYTFELIDAAMYFMSRFNGDLIHFGGINVGNIIFAKNIRMYKRAKEIIEDGIQ